VGMKPYPYLCSVTLKHIIMNQLNGQEITQINVVNDKICIYDDKGNFYYLKSSELIKLVNEFNFEISQPKKYKYLNVVL
jgi:hypothetical protein